MSLTHIYLGEQHPGVIIAIDATFDGESTAAISVTDTQNLNLATQSSPPRLNHRRVLKY